VSQALRSSIQECGVAQPGSGTGPQQVANLLRLSGGLQHRNSRVTAALQQLNQQLMALLGSMALL
jgi:hypothetical protein